MESNSKKSTKGKRAAVKSDVKELSTDAHAPTTSGRVLRSQIKGKEPKDSKPTAKVVCFPEEDAKPPKEANPLFTKQGTSVMSVDVTSKTEVATKTEYNDNDEEDAQLNLAMQNAKKKY